MKRIITICSVFASLFFIGACVNEDEQINNTSETKTDHYVLVVNATKSNGELTRGLSLDGTTLNQKWNEGECVTVIKKDGINWTEIGTLMATASSDANTTLSGSVIASLETGDELLLLFPRTTWDYTGQNGILYDESSETTIEKKYDYAQATVYVTAIDGNNVTVKRKDGVGNYYDGAIFEKEQAIIKFTFSVPVKSVTIRSASGGLVQNYTLDPSGGLGFHPTNGELTITASTDQTVFYVAMRNNADVKDIYSFSATDASNNYYAGVKSAKLVNGKFYSAEVALSPVGISNNHEYVDLGLTSGLKWATMNIEANSIVGYGGYYAWGETDVKDAYNWDNYPYGNIYSCTNLGEFSGSSTYDVARVKWGGSWRMPTIDEFKELQTNCTWVWTTICGISGDLVTGPNGNTIFLPAGGDKEYSSHYDKETVGYYWTTSQMDPIAASPIAYNYCFNKNFSSGSPSYGSNDRFKGFTVRAVIE